MAKGGSPGTGYAWTIGSMATIEGELSQDVHQLEGNLVPRAGIEPATCPLGGGRAIHCATGAERSAGLLRHGSLRAAF